MKSIHFVKDIDNIFKTIDWCAFHIVDACAKEPGVWRPLGRNLIYHIIPSHTQSRARYFLKFLAIKSIIKKIQPDIIHCYGAGVYGLVGFLLNIHPLIITVHGTEIYSSKNKNLFYKILMDKILKNADLIAYVSEEMKKFLINYFEIPQGKLVKIYRGIDPEIFYRFSSSRCSKLRRELSIDKESMVFFSNRRILPLYNISAIIRAFYQINKIFNNTKLILIKGDIKNSEPYFLEIKNQIKDGIENGRIILIEDVIPLEKMAELYNISDFFISIPNSDELSAAILEGMACENIPILTDLEAYAELKENTKSFFIKSPKDIRAITNMMQFLVENCKEIKEEIAQKNRRYVLNNATYSRITNQLLTIYDNLLS